MKSSVLIILVLCALLVQDVYSSQIKIKNKLKKGLIEFDEQQTTQATPAVTTTNAQTTATVTEGPSKKNELTLILGVTIGGGGLLLLIIILILLIVREFQIRNRPTPYTIPVQPSYPTREKMTENDEINQDTSRQYPAPTNRSSLPQYSSQNRAFTPDDESAIREANYTSTVNRISNTSSLPPYSSQNRAFTPDDESAIREAKYASTVNRRSDGSLASSRSDYESSQDDDDSMYQEGGRRF